MLLFSFYENYQKPATNLRYHYLPAYLNNKATGAQLLPGLRFDRDIFSNSDAATAPFPPESERTASPCPHTGEQPALLPFRQDPPSSARGARCAGEAPGPAQDPHAPSQDSSRRRGLLPPGSPYHGPAAGLAVHGPILRGIRHSRTCGERTASAGAGATALSRARPGRPPLTAGATNGNTPPARASRIQPDVTSSRPRGLPGNVGPACGRAWEVPGSGEGPRERRSADPAPGTSRVAAPRQPPWRLGARSRLGGCFPACSAWSTDAVPVR